MGPDARAQMPGQAKGPPFFVLRRYNQFRHLYEQVRGLYEQEAFIDQHLLLIGSRKHPCHKRLESV